MGSLFFHRSPQDLPWCQMLPAPGVVGHSPSLLGIAFSCAGPPHGNNAAKELLQIFLGAALWGSTWAGTLVLFKSDNQAVISALSSRSARDPHISHLLRCLFFFEAHFKFEHHAQHIAGRDNSAADALSCNRLSDFLSIYPQAPSVPKRIPDSGHNVAGQHPHLDLLTLEVLV